MAQAAYENVIKMFDDPIVSVANQVDLNVRNIRDDQDVATYTYSDRFGKDCGPTGICRIFGPESIYTDGLNNEMSHPDLFKLCELRSMADPPPGATEHAILTQEITHCLASIGGSGGLANHIASIIADYVRQPIFEVRGVINGDEFSVATVYELPFVGFPKAPIFCGGYHAQFWFRLEWFVVPEEIEVTSRTGVMRVLFDYDADVTMSDWNLRKKPWDLPRLIDSDHPTIHSKRMNMSE